MRAALPALLLALSACGPGLTDGRFAAPAPATPTPQAASSPPDSTCDNTALQAPVTTQAYFDPALGALQRLVSTDAAGNTLTLDVHSGFGDAVAPGAEATLNLGSTDPNDCGVCVVGERQGTVYTARSGTLLVRAAANQGAVMDTLIAQLLLEGPPKTLGLPPTWCFFSTVPLMADSSPWLCAALGIDSQGGATCWADPKTHDSAVVHCSSGQVVVDTRCAAPQVCQLGTPGGAAACGGP